MMKGATDSISHHPKWKKVAYEGMQQGYNDNYNEESFLQAMVMNANIVKRDLFLRPPGALNNPILASNISLNASIVASVLVSSHLPSRLYVFAIIFFFLQIFLFALLITFCIKKYSFKLYMWFSFALMIMTLSVVFQLHRMLFVLLLGLLIFVSVIYPYWLIRIQEYKFKINGSLDETKFYFDITK